MRLSKCFAHEHSLFCRNAKLHLFYPFCDVIQAVCCTTISSLNYLLLNQQRAHASHHVAWARKRKDKIALHPTFFSRKIINSIRFFMTLPAVSIQRLIQKNPKKNGQEAWTTMLKIELENTDVAPSIPRTAPPASRTTHIYIFILKFVSNIN